MCVQVVKRDVKVILIQFCVYRFRRKSESWICSVCMTSCPVTWSQSPIRQTHNVREDTQIQKGIVYPKLYNQSMGYNVVLESIDVRYTENQCWEDNFEIIVHY